MEKPPFRTAEEGSRLTFLLWLVLNCSALLGLILIYFVWRIPPWLGPFVFGLANIYWLWRVKSNLRLVIRELTRTVPRETLLSATAAVLIDLGILATFLGSRVEFALTSPWQVVGWPILGLFVLSSAFTLAAWRGLNRAQSWLLAVFHAFVTFSGLAAIYSLGFGYDGFVHEAGMSYIHAHGFIPPKSPLYVGAYLLILPLQELIPIPLYTLQAWFLPALAALLLPTAVLVLTNARQAWPIWLLLYAPFTFTVPYNLGLLGLVLTVLLVARDEGRARWAAGLTGLCTLFIHPLAGLPALGIAGLSLVWKWKRGGAVISSLAVGLGTFGVLAYYTKSQGGLLLRPEFSTVLDSARIILRSPAIFSWEHPGWSLLYLVYAAWPFLLILVGCVGLFLGRKRSSTILGGAAAGILFTAIATAATLRYRNIVPAEQYEFSYRLFGLLPWILLPGFLNVAQQFQNRIKPLILGLAVGLLMLANWYVALPQYNPAMPFMAPSASRDDLDSANWIIERADGDFAALAPQLVSAGALRRIGFEQALMTADGPQYPFAIPTGGVLYRYYLELMTGEDMDQALDSAFAYANTKTLAVVIPATWDPYGVIREYLAEICFDSTVVGENSIYLMKR